VAVHSAWPVLCKRTLVPRVTRVLAHYRLHLRKTTPRQGQTPADPAGARPWSGKADKGKTRVIQSPSVDLHSGQVQSVHTYLRCRDSSQLLGAHSFMARRLITLL
jgi:hypothetical protein